LIALKKKLTATQLPRCRVRFSLDSRLNLQLALRTWKW